MSYYTIDSPYEELARRVRVNLDEFGISHEIHGLNDTGRWVSNCALKGPFMRDMMRVHKAPIVWIDLDAEMLKRPDLFETISGVYDMALFFNPKRKKLELISNIMMFLPDNKTTEVLEQWAKDCKADITRWDQKTLQAVVERLEPKVYSLPNTYSVMYRPGQPSGWSVPDKESHVIRQYQVSRAVKGRKRAHPALAALFKADRKGKKN